MCVALVLLLNSFYKVYYRLFDMCEHALVSALLLLTIFLLFLPLLFLSLSDAARPLFTIAVLVTGVVGGLAVVITVVYFYKFCLKKRPALTTTSKPEWKREQIRSPTSSQCRPLPLPLAAGEKNTLYVSPAATNEAATETRMEENHEEESDPNNCSITRDPSPNFKKKGKEAACSYEQKIFIFVIFLVILVLWRIRRRRQKPRRILKKVNKREFVNYSLVRVVGSQTCELHKRKPRSSGTAKVDCSSGSNTNCNRRRDIGNFRRKRPGSWSSAEREAFMQAMPLPTSTYALPPKIDEEIHQERGASGNIFEPKLLSLDSGVMARMAALAMALQSNSGKIEAGGTRMLSYIKTAMNVLGNIHQDITSLRREIVLRAIDVDPRRDMPSIKTAPVAEDHIIHEEEVMSRLFGKSLLEEAQKRAGSNDILESLEKFKASRKKWKKPKPTKKVSELFL